MVDTTLSADENCKQEGKWATRLASNKPVLCMLQVTRMLCKERLDRPVLSCVILRSRRLGYDSRLALLDRVLMRTANL